MNAGLFELWRIWDYIYQHMTRLEYVDKENQNIFRVVFCKYRGPNLTTRDGNIIKHGDRIVRLHIHNWRLTGMLQGISNETRLGLTTLKIVRDSLPALANYIKEHEKGEQAVAIIGTTFLHRGVNRLGFDVERVPDHLKYKIKNGYLRLLLYIIHPNGKERLKKRSDQLIIKRVYMSKEQLYNRYGYQETDLIVEEQ